MRSTMLAALAFAAVAWALPAAAGITQEELRKEPGYFDFGQLSEFVDSEPIVEVRLTQPLISIAQPAMQDEDPDLAKMMEQLKLIEVKVYRCDDKSATALRERTDRWSRELLDRKWEQIVKLRDGNDRANIFVKTEEGKGGSQSDPELSGMTVVAVGEDNKAVFVNIVGRFAFSQIGKLTKHINGVPNIDGMLHEHGGDSTKNKSDDSYH
jgi:hypothetical protein